MKFLVPLERRLLRLYTRVSLKKLAMAIILYIFNKNIYMEQTSVIVIVVILIKYNRTKMGILYKTLDISLLHPCGKIANSYM